MFIYSCTDSSLFPSDVMNFQLLRNLSATPAQLQSFNFVRLCSSAVSGSYDKIMVCKKGVDRNIGFIQLNKPKVLNSLCSGIIGELAAAMEVLNKDESVKCLVLTGNDRAFAGEYEICFPFEA